ncbi:MAG: hypothetical protein JXR45_12050 [Deltaproteobacteria bacterium]|nr:hypothetical protein [Deltaproteobacteria bacterium]
MGVLLSTRVNAQAASADENEPNIVMLDAQGITPYDDELYHSIRAQLAAAPVRLQRIDLSDTSDFTIDPLANALKVAQENDGAMVFWIEDKEECRLFFYIRDEAGGRINSRTLKLELNNSWSRFQVIAIAAASMVEGLLVTYQLHPKDSEKPTEPPPPKPVVRDEDKRGSPKKVEVYTAYSGRLFAPAVWVSGVGQGVGLRLHTHFVTSISYAISFPIVEDTDEYRLSISSYLLGISCAVRWVRGGLDVRFGVEGSVDLRPFSATSRSETITTVDDDIKGIAALSPLVSVSWTGKKGMGFFSRIGADFCLNDTVYSVRRADGNTAEITPYRVKFTVQVGFVVSL